MFISRCITKLSRDVGVVMCVLAQQVVLCRSLRDTSSRLAELGWLHNKVRKYTDARSLDRAFGLVGQVCASVSRVIILSYLIGSFWIESSLFSARASVPRFTRNWRSTTGYCQSFTPRYTEQTPQHKCLETEIQISCCRYTSKGSPVNKNYLYAVLRTW